MVSSPDPGAAAAAVVVTGAVNGKPEIRGMDHGIAEMRTDGSWTAGGGD